MSSSVLQVRLDDVLRSEASGIFDELGLDLPTAIRVFLKRVVRDKGMPFDMTLPRDEYRAEDALAAMYKMGEAARAAGVADMSLDEINEEIEQVRAHHA